MVESQMDDFELIEILPTFLARRWKRTIETLDPVRQREELVATLELFLRVLCAVALADYISGPRTDEEAESEIRGLQGKRGGPSLGDWRRLSDALLKALSRRPPNERFCNAILDWYFAGKGGKLSASARIISEKLIAKRNKAQHGALEMRFSAEEVQTMLDGLREVFQTAHWLSDYQFFNVKDKSRLPGHFKGVLVWFVGLNNRQKANSTWSVDRLESSQSILVAANDGRSLLDLGHLLQVRSVSGELRFDVFYHLDGNKQVILRDEHDGAETAFDFEAIHTAVLEEPKYPETFVAGVRRRVAEINPAEVYEKRFTAFLADGGTINAVEKEKLAELVDGFDPLPIQRRALMGEALKMMKKIDGTAFPALAALEGAGEKLKQKDVDAALADFGRAHQRYRDSRHKNYEAELKEHLIKAGHLTETDQKSLLRMQEGFGLSTTDVRQIEVRVLMDLMKTRLRTKPDAWPAPIKALQGGMTPDKKQMLAAFESFRQTWNQRAQEDAEKRAAKQKGAVTSSSTQVASATVESVASPIPPENKGKGGLISAIVVGLALAGGGVFMAMSSSDKPAEKVSQSAQNATASAVKAKIATQPPSKASVTESAVAPQHVAKNVPSNPQSKAVPQPGPTAAPTKAPAAPTVTVSPVPSPKPVESILSGIRFTKRGNASKTYDMKTEKPRIRAIALDQFGKSMAAKIRYRTTSLGGQAKVSGNGRVTFTKAGKVKIYACVGQTCFKSKSITLKSKSFAVDF